MNSGAFAAEITPVTIKGRKGDTLVERDETPFTVDLAKIATLKPAFRKDGTVTAGRRSTPRSAYWRPCSSTNEQREDARK